MTNSNFKWLTVFAVGVALFSAYALWLMILEFGSPGVKLSRVKGDFPSMDSAIRTYAINAGRPPSTEQGLEAMVSRPTAEPLPDDWVQLMTSVPTDPWKNPYQYRELLSRNGTFRWELHSAGPDGKPLTEDDRYHEGEWKSGR